MCNCNKITSNNTTIQPPMAEITIQSTGVPMRRYIEDRGWKYVGGCGCANAMDIFRNVDFPDKEVRVNATGDRMEIRNIFLHERDTRVVALAGKINFEHIYKMFLG